MTEKLFAWKDDVDATAALAATAAAEAAQAAAEAAQAATEALFAALNLTDPGEDQILAWDDSEGEGAYMSASAIQTLGSPTVGDWVLGYTGNSLRKIEWADLPSVAATLLTGLGDVNISSPTDGQALTYHAGSNRWINSTPVQTFLGLTDTPNSYTGHALKLVRVNAAEDAVEFFTGAFTADAISFDPAGSIVATDVQAAIEELDSELDERIADVAGAMVTGNTETLITVTYQDADNTIDFVVEDDLSLYDNTTSGFLNQAAADALFLTPAEGDAAYQPLDGDLTSWAGVTRASGFDTFAATPSYTNLAALMTDESFALTGVSNTFTLGQVISASNPYIQMTDTDTGADAFFGGNFSTGSMGYWADYNNEVAGSLHMWSIDGSGDGNTMRLSTAALYPTNNNGLALGIASTNEWADLFLAEGGVINWDNGDATLTQTDNDITFAGITTFGVGTSTAVTLGSIELGHASDTTLVRSAAGRVTIESELIPRSTVSSSPPSSPSSGDFWFDLDSGLEFKYVDDGSSSQWVQVGGSGGMSNVPLVLATGTISSAAALDFALDAYPQFTAFKLILKELIPQTDTATPLLRFSDDGGSTFEADASDYSFLRRRVSMITAPVEDLGGDDAHTDIQLASSAGNASNETFSCEITIFSPATSAHTRVSWEGAYKRSDAVDYYLAGGGTFLSTAPATDARFLFNTGNITSGSYTLIGIP